MPRAPEPHLCVKCTSVALSWPWRCAAACEPCVGSLCPPAAPSAAASGAPMPVGHPEDRDAP
eukprot:1172525-Prorocentrum_minimum.AAC.2